MCPFIVSEATIYVIYEYIHCTICIHTYIEYIILDVYNLYMYK